MTAITHPKVEKEQSLQLTSATGWRRGLANLLRKELGQWWGTKMWLIQLIIWVSLLNMVPTIIMNEYASSGDVPMSQQLQEVVGTFLQMQMFTVAIGMVITIQGSIVGERQLGTAAWVMSKPASRAAFIIAKTIAYIIGFGVTAFLIPTAAFLLIAQLGFSLPISLPYFLVGLGISALHLLFYLMLTVMLGVLFNNRGPITGVGIGLLLAGMLLNGIFPLELQMITPWMLPDVGVGLAFQQPLPDIWPIPVVACVVWVVVFTAVALWRFGREEF
jgi:ABC-2 type transport system permease protein